MNRKEYTRSSKLPDKMHAMFMLYFFVTGAMLYSVGLHVFADETVP
jgi:hypothetical protein